MLHLVLIALTLTTLSIGRIGDFSVVVFWPVFLLAFATGSNFTGTTRLPAASTPFLLAIVLMLCSALINHASIKTTSLAFSLAWIVYWFWLVGLARARLSVDIERTLSRVAQIYFVALALSVTLYLSGWLETPMPNFLGWTYNVWSGSPRFYGPTSEPSYAALILGAVGLGILRARISRGLPLRERRTELIFIGILIALLSLRSVYGIFVGLLLVSAVLSRLVSQKSGHLFAALALFSLLPMLAVLAPPESRFSSIFQHLLRLDLVALAATDNSAYMRFGPIFEMLQQVSLGDVEFWVGHGAGTAETFFGRLFGHLAGYDVYTMNLGFFPAFVFDYGALAAFAIVVYMFLIGRGAFSLQARVLMFVSMLNCNFNTNLFWIMISIFFLTSPKIIVASAMMVRFTNRNEQSRRSLMECRRGLGSAFFQRQHSATIR